MDRDFGYGYSHSSHRHKRTHAQMENDGTTSPSWGSIGRLSVSHEPQSPSHPQVSGLHLSRIPGVTPPTQPQRYPGDGMDYRRPITLSRDGSQTAFIDLTADDAAGPSSSNSSRRTPAAGPTSARAQRPPRFAREIIEVVDDGPQPTPDSPEIEFISERRLPRALRREPRERARNEDDEDDLEFLGAHEVPGDRRRRDDDFSYLGNGILAQIGHLPGQFRQGLEAQIERMVNQMIPAARPQRVGARPRGRIHVGFMAPNMDFGAVGFDLGLGGGGGPPAPPPTYEAPPAALAGFTRSPAEGDVLLCPNCEEELCTGDSDLKKQVWILKACGHVYCGDCATYRHQRSHKLKGKEKAIPERSKPFKVCAVDGCDKKTIARGAMIQIFL